MIFIALRWNRVAAARVRSGVVGWLLLAMATALAMAPAVASASATLPNFDAVRLAHQPSDTRVLDRHGELLQRVRTDATVRRGDWVALADLSPALREAMVL